MAGRTTRWDTTWRGVSTVGVTHRTTRADLRFSGG